MRRILEIALFIFFTASLKAQTGPAGIGNSSSNILWLRASDITGLSDGNTLTTWNDVSGNNDSPTQSTSNQRPVYKTASSSFNGKPYVRFDGSNDYLNLTGILSHSASDYTIVCVYKTSSTSKQSIFDSQTGKLEVVHEGSTSDRAYNDGTARGTEITGTAAKIVMWKLDNAGSSIYANGTEIQSGLGYTNRAIGGTTRIGGSIGSGDYFNGDIAELIIFDYALNDAQRIILENSLGNKYGISILYDQYAYQAVHEEDIAGIGVLDGSNQNTTAMSGGILQLSEASGIGYGEGVIFGHDGASISSWSASETPNAYIRRLGREWRLDETGDVGTLTFTIDTTLFPARPSDFQGFVIMLDSDGNFSSGATYYPLTSAGGSMYEATGISFSDGYFVAIGAAQNISIASGNFSAAGTWAFNAVPASDQVVVVGSGHTVTLTANTTLQGITISSGGTLSLGAYKLTLTGNSFTNNGTLNTGTGTVEFSSSSAQTIPATTFNHLTLSGSGTKSLAGSTTVNGTLTLSAGTLDVTASNYSLNVKGAWNNTGAVFNARNGTVTLSGSSNQTVTTNGQSFYNLTVANTATQVSLGSDVTVSNVLTLTDGVVTTGATYKVILSSSSDAALTGYSSASFINGNLRRYFAQNYNTYVFPLGNGTAATNYYRADIVNKNLNGITYFDSKFKPLTGHCDCDLNASDAWEGGSLTYTAVHTAGVWELEPNAQPSSGKYDVKLYIANMSGLEDNNFGPLKRPAGSGSGAAWTTGSGKLANGDNAGRRVSDGYMIRTNLGTFSEFGAGIGAGAGAGLPIELISFSAMAVEQSVHINWATATEINNDYFTIERSVDGRTFETLRIVPGAGNSTVMQQYAVIDAHPYAGVSYYRLIQTDFDGAANTSDLVAVVVEKESMPIAISPNPLTGQQFSVSISNPAVKNISAHVLILDMNGQQVFSQEVQISVTTFDIRLDQQLTAGIYFVHLIANESVSSTKLMVH